MKSERVLATGRVGLRGDIVSGMLAMAHHNEAVDEAIILGTGRENREMDLVK